METDVLAAASFSQARLLIIDDDRQASGLLQRLFSSTGYRFCRCIQDPGDLPAAVNAERPDIVLLSWEIGPSGGLGVLHSLRELTPDESHPSVLVLNAGMPNQSRLDALGAGAVGFIAKPFDPAEVLLRVRNLLGMRRDKMQLEQEVYLRTAQLEEAVGELRQVQRQLQQQERLRMLGTLAAGIAHDFNNALTVVLGFSELFLGRDLSNEEPHAIGRAFRNIATAASDAAATVRRLREFYRPLPDVETGRRWLDVNAIVQESLQLALPKWMLETQARGVTVELREDYGAPPNILGSSSELREVLMNLIFNAIDAMQSGGVLTIRTGACDGMSMFEIGDTGSGMDEETREKCLEPFFTTKGANGSGLGLATTYEIIRRHRGRIDIASALNQGSVFRICLPTTADHEPEDVDVPTYVVRGLRILVVDNQPKVCQVLRDFLLMDGHTIVSALTGREALVRFKEESFDLVITDLVMPVMNGDRLALALKEINPAVPIILFTSLYEAPSPNSPVHRILQKPTGLTELRSAIFDAVGCLPRSEDRSAQITSDPIDQVADLRFDRFSC